MDPVQIAWHLMEGTNDIITSISDEGRFGYVNQAFLDKLGYKEEEIETLSMEKVFYPGEQKKMKSILAGMKDDNVNVETKMVSKVGDVIYVEGSLSPLYSGGKRISTIALFRDITKRMETEEELEKERGQIQFLIDIMTHDLANIHQEIIVMLDFILLNEELPKETLGLVKEGIAEVERANHLIGNVRTISKVTRKIPELKNIDVSESLLRGSLKARLAFPNKKLNIETSIDHSEYFVVADDYLSEVFYSLIHNSLKHTRKDKVNVTIEAQPIKFTPFLRILVSDDGPGIPDVHKDKIFSDSTKRGDSIIGFGLGLTLVKKIVEYYGGYIRVEDRVPGRSHEGVSFVIMLHLGERPSSINAEVI